MTMDATLWLIYGASGFFFVVALVRRLQHGSDARRRVAQRTAWEERQTRDRQGAREERILQRVKRAFPFIADEVGRRLKSGGKAKDAVLAALRATTGVVVGIAEGGYPALLPLANRVRHVVYFAKSGYGKSVSMMHLIVDELRGGKAAVIVMCPEVEFFLDILGYAKDRARDVIYLAASCPRCLIAIGMFQPEAEIDRGLHAERLSSAIKTVLGDIGPRSNILLGYTVALVTGRPGATLEWLRRVLTDSAFRKRLVADEIDPFVRRFWIETYPSFPRGAGIPLINRLDGLLRDPAIRKTLCHPVGSFTIRDVVRGAKLLFVDLSGLSRDARLLMGRVITCLLELELLSPGDVVTGTQKPVSIYVDEFPAVCGTSEDVWATLLSRGRKYLVQLCISAQFPSQLPVGLRQQIAGNVSTWFVLNLSARDSVAAAKELLALQPNGTVKPVPAESIVTLPVGEGYARLASGACAVRIKFKVPLPRLAQGVIDEVREASWQRYAAPEVDPQDEGSIGVAASGSPDAKAYLKNVASPVLTDPDAAADDIEQVESMPGRGGLGHLTLQNLAANWGVDAGFRAGIEQDILGGAGRVDVVLERDDTRIAVEVVMSNRVGAIEQAVTRCHLAGFDSVVVTSPDRGLLDRARARVAGTLSKAEVERTEFLDPDELREFVRAQGREPQGDEAAGYTVQVAFANGEPSDDQCEREAALRRVLRRALSGTGDAE